MPGSWDVRISRESDSLVHRGGRRALVRVFALALGRSIPEAPPSTLVKLSESAHAIPGATHLQIATPAYYRRIENSDAQVRDEMEARYVESRRSTLAKRGFGGVLALDRNASLEVTYSKDDLWLYCTSIAPSSDAELAELRERFEAEATTIIRTPSAFARELGSGVALNIRPEELTPEPLGWLKRRLLPPDVSNVVHVHHGPVYYTDHAEEVLDAVPVTERATLLPFMKRRSYSWQREYRFAVSVIGSPTEDTYRVPIGPNLRALAQPWQSSRPLSRSGHREGSASAG